MSQKPLFKEFGYLYIIHKCTSRQMTKRKVFAHVLRKLSLTNTLEFVEDTVR